MELGNDSQMLFIATLTNSEQNTRWNYYLKRSQGVTCELGLQEQSVYKGRRREGVFRQCIKYNPTWKIKKTSDNYRVKNLRGSKH